MILTDQAIREASSLLMLIEAGADGHHVAQQANEVVKALGGTRDLRTMGPQAVPMYLGVLLLMRSLGH